MEPSCRLHNKQGCRYCWTEIYQRNKCYPHRRRACAQCHPEYFGDQTPEKRLERIRTWFERDMAEMERARWRFNCLFGACVAVAIILALWRPTKTPGHCAPG